jgi:hypothetical protein
MIDIIFTNSLLHDVRTPKAKPAWGKIRKIKPIAMSKAKNCSF